MAVIISKIKLLNYKRFKSYTISTNPKLNIFVGENEVGKSSIIEAIDIVACGNVRKIEAIGIDKLLSISAVDDFNTGMRTYKKLPKMIIELHLDGVFDHTMNGKNHIDGGIACDGIRLVCEPNFDYFTEIEDALKNHPDYFPYDYYSIRFSTFADIAYSGYSKILKSILINSSSMNSDYATNDFIRRIYAKYTEDNTKERAIHKSNYRKLKGSFSNDSFLDLNKRIPKYRGYVFGLKIGSALNLESDMMIFEDDIGIDQKGAGRQVFIKTEFALARSGTNIDVILLEEPENHLSPINLRRLIELVADTQSGQLFIATHSNLISTRLELNNLFVVNASAGDTPTSLQNLKEETAKYFLKAPVAGVLDFTLSSKVILVEGPSEYMLFDKFYESIACNSPEEDGVHIIDIRGLSFKRYLDIAKLTGSRVAIVTDNDGNNNKHCVAKYKDYAHQNIKICYEADDTKPTFEIVLFSENQELCEELFGCDALSYMLNNKTEAAYSLLNQKKPINVPTYIKGAIEWIKG